MGGRAETQPAVVEAGELRVVDDDREEGEYVPPDPGEWSDAEWFRAVALQVHEADVEDDDERPPNYDW